MKKSKLGRQKFVCNFFLQCDFLSLGPDPEKGSWLLAGLCSVGAGAGAGAARGSAGPGAV